MMMNKKKCFFLYIYIFFLEFTLKTKIIPLWAKFILLNKMERDLRKIKGTLDQLLGFLTPSSAKRPLKNSEKAITRKGFFFPFILKLSLKLNP